MHIISKYKDYYDSIAGQVGIDKTRRYMRESSYVEYDFKKISTINDWRSTYHLPAFDIDKHRDYKKPKSEPDYYNYFIIGFCGKLYVGYYFKWKGDYQPYFNPNGTDDVEVITYDFNKVLELTGEYKKPDADTKKSIAKFKSTWDVIHNTKAIDIFRELNVPVFIYNPNHVSLIDSTIVDRNEWKATQLNPVLKTYQFAKVFEPYMVFQEIFMFIGTLGNNENNMVEISDKDRMSSRGMDNTSFRQMAPGQKKENRAANKTKKKNITV